MDITWPAGNGMNVFTRTFSMPSGLDVSRVFGLPIPDSIFVADGNYGFAAYLIYDGNVASDGATITIQRP